MMQVANHFTVNRHGQESRLIALFVLMAIAALTLEKGRAQTNQPDVAVDKLYTPSGAPVEGIPLDRVIAIVNGDVVLDSDVDQEMRFESFDHDDSKLGPAVSTANTLSRSAVLERLINRTLILQQIRLEPHRTISSKELDSDIDQLRKTLPGCAKYRCTTEAGWQAYLGSMHITESMFRAHWLERLEVLAFTEQRFSMGIRITTDQQKSYYDQTLLPEYGKAGVKPPPFDTISARIQEVLVEQQVSALLSDWLHSLRAQGSVLVLHPGEDAP